MKPVDRHASPCGKTIIPRARYFKWGGYPAMNAPKHYRSRTGERQEEWRLQQGQGHGVRPCDILPLMLVVRGSAAFLKALRLAPKTDPIPPDTTALGDWHAHILTIDRRQAALFVNTASLLAVIVNVAPRSGIVERFRAHLARLLFDIGVPEADLDTLLTIAG